MAKVGVVDLARRSCLSPQLMENVCSFVAYSLEGLGCYTILERETH